MKRLSSLEHFYAPLFFSGNSGENNIPSENLSKNCKTFKVKFFMLWFKLSPEAIETRRILNDYNSLYNAVCKKYSPDAKKYDTSKNSNLFKNVNLS